MKIVDRARRSTPTGKRVFYGWYMVGAATVMNVVAGGTFVYGISVFFNPIRNTFGWSAAVTSVGFTLQRLESGLLEVVAGALVDKFGPRRLMLFGWTVVGLGFLMMSQIDSLWAFYGSFLLVATGLSFAVFIVVFTSIANWFNRKRSRAMMFVVTGFGVSGVLVPLLAMAVGQLGWRETLVVVGVLIWIICLPLAGIMRRRPDDYGYLPDGDATGPNSDASSSGLADAGFTLKRAMKTRTFWLLAAASLFQFIGASAVMVHIVPSLESADIPRTQAGLVVTGMTISSLIGRIGFGFLGDFADKRRLIAIGIALQTTGILVLSFVDEGRTWPIIPFLLTYAPGFGATMPLRPALQADYFGLANYGKIMGVMAIVSMLGGLASPIVAGWIFDVTGGYHLAWRLFALMSLPAIPLMLLARPPR
jgi:MFS family permease